MEQGMADLRLGDFEFFKILLPGMAKNKLRLPSKFAEVLGERRELKMRLASLGPMPLWDVELVSSGGGVYLGRGWRQFSRTYDLGEGHLLVFRYDSATVLTVTVFDPSTCRKQYPHGAGAASASRNAPHINEPAHFAVTLRKCNLGAKQNQYLNVPVEFQDAHGYARRRQVVLRMGGRSWTVNLKRGKRALGDRTAFKYGGTSSASTTASRSGTPASSGWSASARRTARRRRRTRSGRRKRRTTSTCSKWRSARRTAPSSPDRVAACSGEMLMTPTSNRPEILLD